MSMDIERTELYVHQEPPVMVEGQCIIGTRTLTLSYTDIPQDKSLTISLYTAASDMDKHRLDVITLDMDALSQIAGYVGRLRRGLVPGKNGFAGAPATPPDCGDCGTRAEITTGEAIYPDRTELKDKPYWMCPACGAYVGCHDGTNTALGTPAGKTLRNARQRLHAAMDPIWKNRPSSVSRKHARENLYTAMAASLGKTREQCHIGMFNLEDCAKAAAFIDGYKL